MSCELCSFSNLYVTLLTSQLILQSTGAQEWHIVSLLADVTSPTTVAHYVSMTSHLRVLSIGKHWPPADSTRCTQTSVYSARTKYIVRHWTSREARYVTVVDGDWSVSPLVAWFAHPCSNPSVASPTSQLILQPFFRLSYVTGFSLTWAAHAIKQNKITKLTDWWPVSGT